MLEPGRKLQDDGGVAPGAAGGEAPGGRGRFMLELCVGELGAARDQRHPVGASLGALGEPVVEEHGRR